MILKKDVSSYVIWALFATFNVLLIAVFGLYSGLFPTSDTTETMLFTGLFTALVTGTCLVVSFLIDRLSVYFMQGKKLNSNLIYLILFVLVLIGGIVLRSIILYNEGVYIKTGVMLFETASVTTGGIITADSIWKLFYLVIMRTVLYFTGDIVIAAIVYQIVLRMIFFILIGVAVRIMTGRVASLIVLSLLMFLPPFITVHILDAASFFEIFVALELIFLAIYFKNMTRAKKSQSAVRFLLYFLLGIGLGALFYIDAGTILFWSPMLLLLFVFKKIKEVLKSFACIIPGAACGFMLTLIVWDGYDVIGPALYRWSSKYFADVLSIESFEVIGESSSSVYATLYLILAIIMLCSSFAFLFHKKTTRLAPVMLPALLVCIVSPIMGETGVNTLRMMTLMCIIVIGGGLACMFTSYDTSDFEQLFGDDDFDNTSENEEDVVVFEPLDEGSDDSIKADGGEEKSEDQQNASKSEDEQIAEESEDQKTEEKSEDEQNVEKFEDVQAAEKSEDEQATEKSENQQTEEKSEYEQAMEKSEGEQTVEKSKDDQVAGKSENDKAAEKSKDEQTIEKSENNQVIEKFEEEPVIEKAEKDTSDKKAEEPEDGQKKSAIEKWQKPEDSRSDEFNSPLTLENNPDLSDNTTDIKVADANKPDDLDLSLKGTLDPSFDDEKITRFVPEGMVVPMDTEEDELPRLGKQEFLERRRTMSKMHNPSGKLKVGRKVITNREFDVDVSAGDDFDLF
ncbi:hypothetical protein [Butyrivibrio fibrisolvens]|uniref:hypothetical protein n=1 Tax=Butyrivibrio fibrisolvens TaxID=831 RepID=UPI0003B63A11|nr:hypothetical protein [Butyrivibrio fibrisolvens]